MKLRRIVMQYVLKIVLVVQLHLPATHVMTEVNRMFKQINVKLSKFWKHMCVVSNIPCVMFNYFIHSIQQTLLMLSQCREGKFSC